eukprot:CAMPEP_0180393056 /NCGR_PEP_ID=MMETSP0989-20121125/33535_1 /TAXON_ID=697907 /ORGANISM="non described non described, Strain CCMP2293" /LENGTH=167 /DNA_ID=CAMNT_0022394893 /DNA_START=634 /DNA_END=1133 /DNA_ORIENTATION=-
MEVRDRCAVHLEPDDLRGVWRPGVRALPPPDSHLNDGARLVKVLRRPAPRRHVYPPREVLELVPPEGLACQHLPNLILLAAPDRHEGCCLSRRELPLLFQLLVHPRRVPPLPRSLLQHAAAPLHLPRHAIAGAEGGEVLDESFVRQTRVLEELNAEHAFYEDLEGLV